ncbi:MAG: hypothetical protein WBK77_07380 [Alphaproteobacteria bacterium]
MAIFLVDPSVNQMRPFRYVLEDVGYEVIQLTDADSALTEIAEAELLRRREISLLIVNPMIGTGSALKSAFTLEETKDCKITGLVLLDRVLEKRPHLAPSVLIFDLTVSPVVEAEVAKMVNKHSVQRVSKLDYGDPWKFSLLVDEKIKKNFGQPKHELENYL